MSKRQSWLTAIAAALVLIAVAQWLGRSAAEQAARNFAAILLPGFKPDTLSYKRELVTFLIISLTTIFGVALFWGRRLLPSIGRGNLEAPTMLLSVLSLLGAVVAPYMLCKLMFVLAAVAAYLATDARRLVVRPKVALLIGFLALSLASIGFGLRAWYPVQLSNDYYELSSNVRVQSAMGPTVLSRALATQCLRERLPAAFAGATPDDALAGYTASSLNRKRTANFPAAECAPVAAMSDTQANMLLDRIVRSEHWQSATGRTLYHHSYIMVPAHHFLKYGLDGQVQYLYGYGNTIAQAAALAILGPSMSSYFNSLPAYEYGGIIVIALLVWQITRSIPSAFIGLAIALWFFHGIHFEPVQLAASFNPLRYFGLATQVSSIALMFRWRNAAAPYLAPLTLAFSAFWNTEYAIVGCFGQGLALLAPSLATGLVHRALALASSIAIAAVAVLWNPLSPYLTINPFAGFFNIWLPSLDVWQQLGLLMQLSVLSVLFVSGSYYYKYDERDLRICIIPVFVLSWIKYYYNPSPPHLSFVYVFAAPIALIYVPWEALGRRRAVIANAAATLALGFALFASMRYWQESQQIRQDRGAFLMERWNSLNDQLVSATPSAPLEARVRAIRKELHPGDRALILSPFDHLLSFYVNPGSYCGHFEIITNAITTSSLSTLKRCVQGPGSVLVVYDKALEVPCRTDFETPCAVKQQVKGNLVSLMKNLRPSLHYVGSSQDLAFYRGGSGTAVAEDSRRR